MGGNEHKVSTEHKYETGYVLSESALKSYLQRPLGEISLGRHFWSTIKALIYMKRCMAIDAKLP